MHIPRILPHARTTSAPAAMLHACVLVFVDGACDPSQERDPRMVHMSRRRRHCHNHAVHPNARVRVTVIFHTFPDVCAHVLVHSCGGLTDAEYVQPTESCALRF